MNLFFIFLFKSLTYARADIRGTRSGGDKRRIAWPEMLIVIFPLYWAINIVTNALMYLRVLESNGGYAFLTVQVSAYQWGWKYCYGDTFYPKYFNNPIKVGYNSTITLGGGVNYIFKDALWNANKGYISNSEPLKINNGSVYKYENKEVHVFTEDKLATLKLRSDWNRNMTDNQDISSEVYFCRWWLKNVDILEKDHLNTVKNKLFHSGYWITAQGLDPNTPTWLKNKNSNELVQDPLRLLRSTGSLVLPTRTVFRLMSCSEDITHSWAVPGLGIKMDCVPGRLFCVITSITREGVYYGQCSELCGWNHYNMPIILYALPIEHFIIWWELELHSIFMQSINIDSTEKSYFLLNYKYK
jgi:heme/copper-type cytochrome/quinol oxidase subunit 2